MDFLLNVYGIRFPSYLDLGAHHPTYLNNTYIFYQRGCRGINVEANPHLMAAFQKRRSRDTNLNIGIANGNHEQGLDFYVMNASTMSTFSEEEAKRLEKESSLRISQVLKIPTINLKSLINKYSKDVFPDILTCDLEGLDDMIVDDLQSFEKCQLPKVICLETVTYQEVGFGSKKNGLIEKTRALGYTVHADTFINTIFARSDLRA